MDWKTHREHLLKDPAVCQALKESELEFQIAKAIIDARIKHGLSQKELAKKLHTQQSVISRVENAKTTPSLSFLKRLARALDTSLQVHFHGT
ncbi:helix-turn-helix transcriptional regulator [Candidatus Daviesbacteria bacterium]|nr:helix-turn-helix transcriptional regulator [Candidatus Daviesbacteria bacterium]